MTEHEHISPEVEITNKEVPIPIYLPDRTEIGRGLVQKTEDGVVIEIRLDDEGAIPQLVQDQVMGISMVYMDLGARDADEAARNADAEATE